MIPYLEELIEQWASDCNFLESYRRTQFNYEAPDFSNRNVNIIKWLVSKEFDIMNYDLYSIGLNDKDSCAVSKWMVSLGTDITVCDNAAVKWAAANGHLKTVKYLLSQGADITDRDNRALGWAAEGGHLDTVKYLVSQGADITANNNYALKWATKNGHLKVLEFLESQLIQ